MRDKEPVAGARKASRPAGDTDPSGAGGCPVRLGADGVWRVAGVEEARAVLRSHDTVQAGLGVESTEKLPSFYRRPVLYRDGPEHREDRRQTARFFTPRRVDRHYRPVMERVAEAQLTRLRAVGEADLTQLAFHLAIAVAAEVIGLTESRPGTDRRLEAFFPDEKFDRPGFTSLKGLRVIARQNRNWLRFYTGDVRPAVRARRTRRRDDLISHLIDEGCSAGEILGECITFAAAGMVTTREFVSLAAWHLFTGEELLAAYRAADEPERLALLREILRLEPVIPTLRRRTTAALEIADGAFRIPAGAVVEIDVGTANLDPRAVGPDPGSLCPARAGQVARGADAPPVLSFGDGPHRCPGADIALLETDVFLTRLFAEPGLRMRTAPRVSSQRALGSYELREFHVEIAG
ncbi:cytochrome P450 [Streptomyces abyssomicinicus]|uniref:cytochrome P450 n=1 Tax=Streptomyces abyssomicinicus TaxID=574929 RepID=UPI001250BA2E|nr:cytochrome P450 [Streptomyces abyssomicinicus]